MPISDLLGKRARTASGVEVSAPTVRTFFRALEVFGREIAAVRSVARLHDDPLSIDDAIAPFIKTPGVDGRLAYVLEGLASADALSARPEEVAYAVAGDVLPLASRINAFLGDPDAEMEAGDDGDVEPERLWILGIQERLHCDDPEKIMGWSLAHFLGAVTAFSRPPKAARDPIAELAAMTPGAGPVPIVGGATYPDAVA